MRLRDFPLIVVLWLGGSALMALPLANAVRLREWEAARVFLYHGLFYIILGVLVGIAASASKPRKPARYQLMTLLAVYALFPLGFALPIAALAPAVDLQRAYFEALSSLTTTGATLFPDPSAVIGPVHLWRATLGWMGGFLTLLAAVAILEPMNLGGYEIAPTVMGRSAPMQRSRQGTPVMRTRLLHHAWLIGPVYVGLTAVLALVLLALDDPPLVAVCHAMAVLSTSGISPGTGLSGQSSGLAGEAVIALLLLTALTQKSYTVIRGQGRLSPSDPELRLAWFIVWLVTAVLFLRHFVAAVEVEEQLALDQMALALWGTAFTVFSFLTTLGMESSAWGSARDWTGLPTPGVILLGLTMIGGGVATTAGGVKLLRVFALYRHSLREIDRLALPRSVGGAGITARRIRREGAYIAWIFLMVFLTSLATALLALSLAGVPFDAALALAIAALTNTGPAAAQLVPSLSYGEVSDPVRIILCVAMVVGRLEVLVVVALFNPDYWRR